MRFHQPFSLLLAFMVSSLVHAAPTIYDGGSPTSEEQYLLEKLNRARLDPVGEGQRLAAWLRLASNAGTVAGYRIDPDQVASDFAALPAVAPLAFNPGLLSAARAHSVDLAAHDGNGPGGDNHAGYDGSSAQDRVKTFGYTGGLGAGLGAGLVGESFDPGAADLDSVHAGFLVDWGNADLGHRKMLMGGDDVREIGVGLASKPVASPSSFPLVCTEDLGWPGQAFVGGKVVTADAPAFLVGVVYNDANGNGQYDVGEGIAGATVTVDDGAYSTVTGASGGYTLPLVRSEGVNIDGATTVHVAGLPDGVERAASVTITTASSTLYGTYRANAKWDVVMNQPVDGGTTSAPSATLSGGGIISRSAAGKVAVKVSRPVGSDESQPLLVLYSVKGSATAGADYKELPGSVTIPAGAASAKIKVVALPNGASNSPVQVILKLKKAKGAGSKATVTVMP